MLSESGFQVAVQVLAEAEAAFVSERNVDI